MRGTTSQTTDDSELRLVAEQIWPSFTGENYYVTSAEGAAPGWVEIERFSTLGRAGRIAFVLPPDRAVASRGLRAHAGLRSTTRRLARIGLSLAIASRAVPMKHTVALYGRPETMRPTVLGEIGGGLGISPAAVMHVRRTANRKALMQVLDQNGRTVGYAKIARDGRTAAGIRTETRVLEELAGGSERLRVPRVILAGDVDGLPYLVTEPLPHDLRAVSESSRAPSIEEFTALMPVVRWDVPAGTGHFRDLQRRAAEVDGAGRDRRDRLARLIRTIASERATMPVASRFHGDFAFWNLGRHPGGTLWCWDFEDAADDALAGMDVFHWYVSRRREGSGARGLLETAQILAEAAPELRALGVGSRPAATVLYKTYIAEIVVRTLETADASGWEGVWCSPADLDAITESALLSDPLS